MLTTKKIDKVIEKLELINIHLQENKNIGLDLKNTSSCGSFLCLAGWYEVFSPDSKMKKIYKDYRQGAEILAKDLGFKCQKDLQDFLEDNPLLWGNHQGYFLFSAFSAFGVYEDDKIKNFSFADILKQFYKLKKNLQKKV